MGTQAQEQVPELVYDYVAQQVAFVHNIEGFGGGQRFDEHAGVIPYTLLVQVRFTKHVAGSESAIVGQPDGKMAGERDIPATDVLHPVAGRAAVQPGQSESSGVDRKSTR